VKSLFPGVNGTVGHLACILVTVPTMLPWNSHGCGMCTKSFDGQSSQKIYRCL
jgi:hypothetical protein